MRGYSIRIILYLLLFYILLGVVLCESTLHLPANPLNERAKNEAQVVARHFDAEVETVQVPSSEGFLLRGWLFRKHKSNGYTVLLLHGQADNRTGMLGQASLFLHHRYNVLDPDMRAHGESGGSMATYGVREADDVHRWLNWLAETERPECVFGLGESMGAAILLESLSNERRFCAIVADSSFASLREIAYDRIGEPFRAGTWLGSSLLRPAVEAGFLYARIRYGINLEEASPLKALAASSVPVLLIHGMKDDVILPRHSRMLLGARPRNTELWEADNAGHMGVYARQPEEFERRVIEFLTEHAQKPASGSIAP